MGFFSKLKKSLNPVNLVKNPKQALSYAFDPAGTAIRAGRGAPMTLRSGLDPSGMLLPGQQQGAQQTPYQPQHQMRLSPGAQALYDQMKARTAAREQARAQQTAAPQQAAPQLRTQAGGLIGNAISQLQQLPPQQPTSQQPAVGVAPPQPRMRIPNVTGRPMADGGAVRKDGCENYKSKAFARKPNGKPYGK